jgi:hypothetical protein
MTDQQQTLIDTDKIQVTLSKKELDILFKFLSRTELKGLEVPEFNKILEIFSPKNIKKI